MPEIALYQACRGLLKAKTSEMQKRTLCAVYYVTPCTIDAHLQKPNILKDHPVVGRL